MAAHNTTMILFEIGGCKFEGVGFLNEGERSVDGDEMLTRTAVENHGAIGEEQKVKFSMHRIV